MPLEKATRGKPTKEMSFIEIIGKFQSYNNKNIST
jgi:hypothetical protein